MICTIYTQCTQVELNGKDKFYFWSHTAQNVTHHMSCNLNSFISINLKYVYKDLFKNKFRVKTNMDKSRTPKLLLHLLQKYTYYKGSVLY